MIHDGSSTEYPIWRGESDLEMVLNTGLRPIIFSGILVRLMKSMCGADG